MMPYISIKKATAYIAPSAMETLNWFSAASALSTIAS
jgi:hypothetical protein